jgi:hypothetical protein
METSLAKNIHKCNPQTDSPIWRLPQEIRDMVCGSIFSLSSGLLSRFLIEKGLCKRLTNVASLAST